MEETVKRVLFVNSEMTPYLTESEISSYCRTLAQGIQEKKVEIRSFMPRYGLVNERKNQLHEVIRLSGMNIIIDNVDRPLIIKVASLPAARMQVYFIDNEDYFHRKALYTDKDGAPFKDNGERAIFFARGVLETVKKLRWSPDVIHCTGWISHILPLYLKKYYKDDPIFANSKVVLSLFDDVYEQKFGDKFNESVLLPSITADDVPELAAEANGINLAKTAIRYSDGVVMCAGKLPEEVEAAIAASGLPVLGSGESAIGTPDCYEKYKSFYNSL